MTAQTNGTRRDVRRRRVSRAVLGIAMLTATGVFGLPACSLFNQEGPDATCEDLGCGRINACQEGIIAQCEDGVHLKYHACEDPHACTETWQVKGQYKCSQDDTDCEGCRPDRVSCDDLGAGGGASQSSSASG